MFTLENIIDSKAGREIKRAIAVKMVSQGFLVKDICELLDVSDAFVSKWKRIWLNMDSSQFGALCDQQR